MGYIVHTKYFYIFISREHQNEKELQHTPRFKKLITIANSLLDVCICGLLSKGVRLAPICICVGLNYRLEVEGKVYYCGASRKFAAMALAADWPAALRAGASLSHDYASPPVVWLNHLEL